MSAARQRGMALAFLTVMLAALSLLVVGLATESRTDARLTQVFMQRAMAGALAEGAAHLALRDMSRMPAEDQRPADAGPLRYEYRMEDYRVSVAVTPYSGLLNIASMSVELIERLLGQVGGVSRDEARRLAERIDQMRKPRSDPASGATFVDLEVPEDLLGLAGLQRDVYERIAPLIMVGQGGSDISPLSSPPALAALLGQRPDAEATSEGARLLNGPGTAPLALGSGYRLDIQIRAPDGRGLSRRIDASVVGSGSLPWRLERLYPVIVQPDPKSGR